MKSTSTLRALCQPMLKPDQLCIHPNDGFDLGMMTTGYDVDLEGAGPMRLKLVNDCPKASVELPPKLFEKIGKPRHAILKYDGVKLFIEPL
jgi:hypothetical protein